MGCRCNERGQAMRDALAGIAKGDTAAVGKAAAFIARSAAEDARTAANTVRAKAAARLGSGRR